MNLKTISLISFLLISTNLLAQDSSFVQLNFNSEKAFLVIDNDFEEVTEISSGDVITVLAGTRYLSLGLPNNDLERFYVQAPKDSLIVQEIQFSDDGISASTFNNNFATAEYFQANMMILSEPDTEIMYGDSLMGVGFAIFKSDDRFPGFQLRDNQGTISNIDTDQTGQFTVIEKYVRPNEYSSRTLSFIPGAAQWHKQQKLKSVGFAVGTIGLTTLYFLENSNYDSKESDYFTLLEQYRSIENESAALQLGNQLDRQANDLQSIDNRRRLFLGLAILTYAGNIADAFLSTPKGGYSNPRPLQFYIDGINIDGQYVSTATVKVNLDSIR